MEQESGNNRLGREVGCLGIVSFSKILAIKIHHTREGLQGSRRFLLQLFTDFVREKQLMYVALVAQSILVVRANGGVKMILDLEYKSC